VSEEDEIRKQMRTDETWNSPRKTKAWRAARNGTHVEQGS
jgi:hypothetical protein